MVWGRLCWYIWMLVVLCYFSGGIKMWAAACTVEEIYLFMSGYIFNYRAEDDLQHLWVRAVCVHGAIFLNDSDGAISEGG